MRKSQMLRFWRILSLSPLLALATVSTAPAGSATWQLNPVSGDWNTATNWTPATIPSSETDIATFGVSNVTNVICGDAPGGGGTTTLAGAMVFSPDASSYTIAVTPVFDNIFPSILEIHGSGITNNSGVVQHLVAARSGTTKESGRIYFFGSSSAGEDVVITNEGGASSTGDAVYGAFTQFGYDTTDTPTAGRATLINEGATARGTIYGGFTNLGSFSNAERATFINNPGTVSGAAAGHTLIQTRGNLGRSTFVGNPATVSGAEGGWTEIDYGTTEGAKFIANGARTVRAQAGQMYAYGGDGYATFIANGGQRNGAEGGFVDIFNLPNSERTVIMAKPGTNGGLGGRIFIEGQPVVGLTRFRLQGNGTMDLSGLLHRPVTIGSLSGEGSVTLAGHSLSIGSNNLDTTFSGVIQDSGAVSKVGSGILTLSGASTYMGVTTVIDGTLAVTNKTDSATGSGGVKVDAGSLGGSGIIAGTVTIGTGKGAGAILAPGVGSPEPTTLTIAQGVTFKADATYAYSLKAKKRQSQSDQVIAKGVTIESGAQFNFLGQVQGRLPEGKTFSVISNTAMTPISGAFANLPEGAILTVSGNNLQASYIGGDGNDLTLSVLP